MAEQNSAQLSVAFNAEEDRMLFTVNTGERPGSKGAVHMWFTRRFVKRFWQALIKVLETDPEIASLQQENKKVKDAMMSMQHQDAVNDLEVERGESKQSGPPAEVALVTGVGVTMSDGGIYHFAFRKGEEEICTLNIGRNDVHSLCQLLISTIGNTDWDLDLAVGDPASLSRENTAQVH